MPLMLLVKDEIHCVLLLNIHLLMTDGLMYLIIIVLVFLTAFSYTYSLICMLDDKEDSFNHVYTNVKTTYKFKTFFLNCKCSCPKRSRGWTSWISATVKGPAQWKARLTESLSPGQMAVRTALAWYGYDLSGDSGTLVFPLIMVLLL